MNLQSLLALLQQPAVITGISGMLVALILQVAKKIDSIPLNSGQTNRLRIACAILSFLAAIVTRVSNHNLADASFWNTLILSAVTYGIAYLTHASIISDPNAPAVTLPTAK